MSPAIVEVSLDHRQIKINGERIPCILKIEDENGYIDQDLLESELEDWIKLNAPLIVNALTKYDRPSKTIDPAT